MDGRKPHRPEPAEEDPGERTQTGHSQAVLLDITLTSSLAVCPLAHRSAGVSGQR